MFLGRLCILLYFFGLSLGSIFLICTLWAASPNDTPATALDAPVECKDGAESPPSIVRLEPEAVAVGENSTNVGVVGCNLQNGAKVTFNGVERMSFAAGKNRLIVPLLASDFAGAGAIAVVVSVPGAGNQGIVPSNVRSLRIKPASEVTVVWKVGGAQSEISVELRMILLVLLVGGFSACVYGLNSFANYAGTQKLEQQWYWLYFARPILGAGIAFVFYLIIRGGFLAGTNADAQAVNPFGFVAVAALVGMFSDPALMKLNEVFDTLFRAKDTRPQSLDELMVDAPAELPGGSANKPYKFELKALNGAPQYTWTAVKGLPSWLTLSTAGVLEGTPAASETASITVQVADGHGKTARKDLTLKIV
jgi:hypothetical protein